MSKTALVLPAVNAESVLPAWLEAFSTQTCKPDRLVLVDSSSNDRTVEIISKAGFEVMVVRREDFSHGGTRQMCVERLADCDIIVFLTQDAVLASNRAIEKLLAGFDDPEVGAVYGRQLPRPGADPIEAHARVFNYPDASEVKSMSDIPRMGIKTVFISNSFAAYRRTALMAAGGFPRHTIQNEDTYTASKLILSGWKVVYSSGAEVYHSHHFNYRQEFHRYFDIGVFHARDRWICQNFGRAGGEGLRYVRSELSYLRKRKPSAIPSALIRTALKLAGFKLGHRERWLPVWLKKKLSGNKEYWLQADRGRQLT